MKAIEKQPQGFVSFFGHSYPLLLNLLCPSDEGQGFIRAQCLEVLIMLQKLITLSAIASLLVSFQGVMKRVGFQPQPLAKAA
ncbi:MAG: hypothetical protein VKL98_04975, partial [Cyanobacteriota bacterium]|nr:hypothetical protein [Cyanobacteriota bacterium]